MRKLLLAMFIGTSLYFTLPAVAIAEEHEDFDMERAQQHLDLEEGEMELEQRRAEMEHENQMRELELEKHRAQMKKFYHRPHKDKYMPLVLLCLVVNILVTVWVYQDIRTRGTGSGIWIVIALVAGLLGALVYAVVRLGDVKQS
ncbi:MAG: hypothetical protein ACYTEM_01580 [Planctomycetota bacterium]|jgi:uncharacterized membrane protein (DUF106 family)